MRLCIAVFLSCLAGVVCCAAADIAGPVRIPRDIPVQLRLRKALSSASAHPNDMVEFEVWEDVRANDLAVIPRGSLAWGSVVEASPKARMARSGKLEIDISAACLADGTRVLLRADPHGNGLVSHDASSNESLFALPALPLLLFVYGKDVSIPEGKLFTVYTDEVLNLDAARIAGKGPNRSCGPSTGAVAAAPVPGGGSLSTVKAESLPSQGEVYVDGKFFGNTPSTLRLPAGEHLISVRLSGRRSWERVVSLTPGGETVVSAVLEDQSAVPTVVAARPESKERQ